MKDQVAYIEAVTNLLLFIHPFPPFIALPRPAHVYINILYIGTIFCVDCYSTGRSLSHAQVKEVCTPLICAYVTILSVSLSGMMFEG